MPLQRMVERQIDSLEEFLLDPEQTLRCIRCDGDVKGIVLKILAGMERAAENPHVMIPCASSFRSTTEYFQGLLEEVREQYRFWEVQLKAVGIQFDFAAEPLRKLPPDERFVKTLCAFARAFPDQVGALVVVLNPEEIVDVAAFGKALAFLTEKTDTPWLKYLLFDQKKTPALKMLEDQAPKTTIQAFSLDPADMDKEVAAQLAVNNQLPPAERRQYMAMSASFAFAHKDYEKALKLQQAWLKDVETNGPPADAANALYSLGNTYIAKKDYPAAELVLSKALKLAADHQLKQLVPLLLTNFGVAVHRQKRPEEAVKSFRMARQLCKAEKLGPIEAHVLDLWAQSYQADQKHEEAEQCWLDALAIYDGISADAFAPMKEGGQTDILDKLEQLYKATRQRDKLNKLKQRAGVGS